jgi:hypothetical protein
VSYSNTTGSRISEPCYCDEELVHEFEDLEIDEESGSINLAKVQNEIKHNFEVIKQRALELFPHYRRNLLFPHGKKDQFALYAHSRWLQDSIYGRHQFVILKYEVERRRGQGRVVGPVHARLTLGIRDPTDRIVYDKFSLVLGAHAFGDDGCGGGVVCVSKAFEVGPENIYDQGDRKVAERVFDIGSGEVVELAKKNWNDNCLGNAKRKKCAFPHLIARPLKINAVQQAVDEVWFDLYNDVKNKAVKLFSEYSWGHPDDVKNSNQTGLVVERAESELSV